MSRRRRPSFIVSSRQASRTLLALGGGALLLVTLARPAAAGPEDCRGTQKWHAGACRYPADIDKMKQEEAQRRAAEEAARQKAVEEAQRKAAEEAARRKAAEQAEREALERAQREAAAAAAAREQARPDEAEPDRAPEPSPASTSPAEPAPAPAPAPGPDDARADDGPSGGGISPLVWVGFGLAVAGVVVGSATGAASAATVSDLEPVCPGGGCPPDREGDIDEAMTLAHVSTVSFVLAGAGAALGVVGIFLSGEGGAGDEAAGTAPSLQLVATPAGAWLGGRF